MKKIVILVGAILSFVCVNAQNIQTINVDSLQNQVIALQSEVARLSLELGELSSFKNEVKSDVRAIDAKLGGVVSQNTKRDSQLASLKMNQEELEGKVATLEGNYVSLTGKQQQDKEDLTIQIDATKKDIENSNSVLNNRSLWAVISISSLLFIIIAVVVVFRRRIKNDSNSIDEVRKVQANLENAQRALQEESLKLDNKLLEVVEKQLNDAKHHTFVTETASEADHSLALKIADEIVRIEANLSRMDSSIKGHKQLSKAVERIKNNFSANGYEIVDMLGKPYIQGMKAAVTFVTDDSLEPGIQIISKIIKPQVNYKQEMIQAAQIEVSQTE